MQPIEAEDIPIFAIYLNRTGDTEHARSDAVNHPAPRPTALMRRKGEKIAGFNRHAILLLILHLYAGVFAV